MSTATASAPRFGVVARLKRWAFGPGDPRQLAALRIGLCAVLAVRLASRTDHYLGLADQPQALYRPLSYMQLLDAMPSRGVVIACLAVAIVAAALATAGAFARTMLAAALLASLLLNGMDTSQGKVNHNEVLLTLCLLAIVLARHGDAWSVDAWRARRRGRAPAPAAGPAYGWPVRAAMMIVALSYLIAGLHKVVESGGLCWASSDNMRWLLYLSSDAQGHNGAALWIADHALIAHLSAYGLLATELLFLSVLPAPRLRWIFVPAAIALHAGTWITLRLDYSAQALTVVIVFVSWPAVAASIDSRARHRSAVLKRQP